ncbi:hypothetical protein [Helicobacter labacensis]|uniref:hypothetical protein n=1 Tax=Helicobacter labacensis TaxID=2316079 RepID=UPI001F3981E5|nr:hypothetical protein [Helicobacter labacensis]
MKTNRFKSGILKSKFIPKFLGIGLLVAMPCMLSAENSGFYGAVGFQYSNMTRASSSNGTFGEIAPSGEVYNFFHNQPGVAPTIPSSSANTYNTPSNKAQLGVSCSGPQC